MRCQHPSKLYGGPYPLKTVVVRYSPHNTHSYADCEALARRALPTRGRFVILGESFSGPVAIALAASRPKGLVGLLLCVSFASNPHPMFKPFTPWTSLLPVKAAPMAAVELALLGRSATPTLRAALHSALETVPTSTLQARMRAVLAVDVRNRLREVAVPMVYVRASTDLVVPARAGDQILRLRPDAQLVSLDGPHCLLQVAPEPAANAVQAFLHSL